MHINTTTAQAVIAVLKYFNNRSSMKVACS